MASDWKEVSLGEIVNFTPKRTIKKGTTAPFISMADVTENSKFIKEVFEKEYTGGGSRFANGDTLFARITPCLQNGKCSKVSGMENTEIGHGSTEFIVMAAKMPEYDEDYIYYLARLPKFRAYAESRMIGSTGRQRVSWQDLEEYEFAAPPPNERKDIGSFLSSLDDKIELNRQMNETLEAMAQTLFKSWFVDFDPVIDNALAAGNAIPDELLERAEQRKGVEKKDNSDIQGLFPDEFEFTEEMGWIPKGWGVTTLDDLTTELRRGISPKYTEVDGVRVVNQRCIRNHSIDYSVCRLNDANIRKVEGRYLEVGDVLVNSTGVGTLGRMAQVFYLDEPAVVDSHVTVVRPNTELVKPYTFGRLMLSIEPLVESMGLGSTGQTELSRVHLGELVVCVPPLELQGFVEKSFSSYSDKSAFNLQQNITLAKLRDTLLPKLMSGELRISDTEVLVDEVL